MNCEGFHNIFIIFIHTGNRNPISLKTRISSFHISFCLFISVLAPPICILTTK